MTTKHRGLNMLATLWLLLCIAIVVAWVRSYWIDDVVRDYIPVRGNIGYRLIQANSDYGSIFLSFTSDSTYPMMTGSFCLDKGRPHPEVFQDSLARRLGFGYWSIANGNRFFRAVRVPHGLFALPCILRAKRLFRRARKAQRWNEGLCPTCGYDLRASKEQCPECGTENREHDKGPGRHGEGETVAGRKDEG